MPDTLDLTGDIASAIDGALLRGHPVVLGYVDDDGYAAMSFRGSTQVHGPTQLALWARNPADGFVKAISERPQVSLLYFGGQDGPGPRMVSFRGLAHVDPSASDAVYAAMVQAERDRDPERNGVAVLIDVQSVRGVGAEGPFELSA